MNWVDVVFFVYMFIGFYMLSLFFFIYLPNRKKLFYYPRGKPEPVSVIVPCYNGAETIGHTIDSILALDYPKNMIEVIVVDDKSTDNTREVVKKYAKKHRNVRLIINKRNSGGAAEPTNIGVKAAKFDYVVVADDDSAPAKDALIKMIGFLQEDKTVGGVTCSVIAKKPVTFIQKLQEVEYLIICFNRKMLDFVDAVYVTPGPFALYKKKVLIEIGLFDTKNMTQDIEIVWRMLSYGYKARMCLAAQVYTSTPSKLKQWWRQRVRWNMGGAQCILKHKKSLFKHGMLGAFIIPFFSISLFIGLFGLGLYAYLTIRRLLIYYLTTYYAVHADTAIVRLQGLSFAPSILNFFGFTLFFIGVIFSFFVLRIISTYSFKHKNVFNVMFYHIVYLTIYPLINITAIYRLLRKKYAW